MEERIRKIWESRYGKEAREPIAVLLENINGTLGKKEDEEKKEVRDARGGFETLRKRMDDIDEKLSGAVGKIVSVNDILGNLKELEEI